MFCLKLSYSDSLEEAAERFRKNVIGWVQSCRDASYGQSPSDAYNQFNFIAGALPMLDADSDRERIQWIREECEFICRHFHQIEQWHDGYWKCRDVRRGTSMHLRLIQPLLQLDQSEPRIHSIFEDAVEHIINGKPTLPAWFDWDTGLFRSCMLGTNDVVVDKHHETNFPAHLRLVQLAISAFDFGYGTAYIDVAKANAELWAQAILKDEALPLALTPSGPLYAMDGSRASLWHLLELQPAERNTLLDCAEYFLAADAPRCFLRLWQISGESIYYEATERLMEILMPEIFDVDAGAVAAMLRACRGTPMAETHDATLLALIAQLNPYAIRSIGLEIPTLRAARPSGVGKRRDLPQWQEDTHDRVHNLITLTQAALINHDAKLATRILDLADGYLTLGRQAFRSGKLDPTTAQSVSALLRGHDREAFCGLATEVYVPLRDAFL